MRYEEPVDWAEVAKGLPEHWQLNIDNSGIVVLNANGPVYGYFPVKTKAEVSAIVQKAEQVGLLEEKLQEVKDEFRNLQKGVQ